MFSIQPGIRPARGRHHRGRQKQNIAAAPTCDKENQVRWHPSFKGSVSWWGFCWRFDLNIDNVSVIRWPEPEVRPVVELRYSKISSKWCKTVNVSFCVSKLRSEKLSAKTCQRIRPFQMLKHADCFPEKKWTSTSARHICSQVMNWNKRGHIYQSHIWLIEDSSWNIWPYLFILYCIHPCSPYWGPCCWPDLLEGVSSVTTVFPFRTTPPTPKKNTALLWPKLKLVNFIWHDVNTFKSCDCGCFSL